MVPAVGLAGRQPGIDHGQDGHAGIGVLGQQEVQQRFGDLARVDETDSSVNAQSTISQDGQWSYHNNHADVTQTGTDVTSTIGQVGTNLTATVTQGGSDNTSMLTQTGDANTATVGQNGTGNDSTVTQGGTGHTVSVTQN